MTRAVLLLGHGSRDPAWRAPMDAVARRIRQLSPGTLVGCAFLELQEPDLPAAAREAVAAGASAIAVLPMFLGVGRHAREDLPALVGQVRDEHPALLVQLLPTVGESPEVVDLLAEIALQVAP